MRQIVLSITAALAFSAHAYAAVPDATAFLYTELYNPINYGGPTPAPIIKTSTVLDGNIQLHIGPNPTLYVTSSASVDAKAGTISANIDTFDSVYAVAQSSLIYDYEITGVKAGTLVPVDFSDYLNLQFTGASGGNGAAGVATFNVNNGGFDDLVDDNVSAGSSSPFVGNHIITVTAGDIYSVQEVIQVDGDSDYGPPGPQVMASVGPTVITIDPTFLAANSGAEVSLSPNLGASAVPEPTTWAYALVGVCLAGGALRMSRRKRGAVAIA
jgi:hypothetical protein